MPSAFRRRERDYVCYVFRLGHMAEWYLAEYPSLEAGVGHASLVQRCLGASGTHAEDADTEWP
jgi:hypothetical protein